LFSFSGDDADKKIRILSGGEKARVALAKTIVSKANFLMLDEPTNHLDMHSCDLLIEALNKYAGSMILVSHDRYFISKTANKIWEIVDHEIKEFKGGYEEWVEWKERMAEREIKQGKEVKNPKQKTQLHDSTKKDESTQTQNPANSLHNPINRRLRKSWKNSRKPFKS
jgi:ATP-binding cassette subfamily F protein 3